MKLKKIASLILMTVFAGALITGCGNGGKSETAVSETEKKLGMISHMNVNEEQYNSFLKTYEARAGVKLSYQIIIRTVRPLEIHGRFINFFEKKCYTPKKGVNDNARIFFRDKRSAP